MNQHPLSCPGMQRNSRTHGLLSIGCIYLLLFILATTISNAQGETGAKRKETGTMVRMLCVQSLTGDDKEVILATKTKDGKWKEHGKVTLRSPFISQWIQIPKGTTHLLRKQGKGMISLGSFKSGKKLHRAILVLMPDTTKKTYRINVINPEQLKFQKGKALILNYSKIIAVVKLGGKQKVVKPGQMRVVNIVANKDNMYRLLVSYVNKDKKVVACYDRFVSSNPKTRKFLLLFPDTHAGLRV
ncbi:MAG TPA: hypothetical protein DHW77_07435, partial [Verrucomicrobiales bacterium]|nr:hypothetical protein [Verrucomicrobiales bacterium]